MTKNIHFHHSKITQRRIIFLITALLLLGISGLYDYRELEHSRVMLLLKDEEAKQRDLLKKIIQFKSAGLNAYTKDYTYWDEMVQFAKTGDTAWAKANIEASMGTYEADYIWVFDNNFSRSYFYGFENSHLIEPGILTKDMLVKLTTSKRLFHFFIQTDSVIIEISGATIHPTLDPNRLTDPMGYFVVGRLWSKKLLNEFSGLTGSNIQLMNIRNKDNNKSIINDNEYIIKSFLPLKSFDENDIALVSTTKEVTILKLMQEQSNREFAVMVIFVSVVLMFAGYSLYYLINLPLKKISLALNDSDAGHIKTLLDKNNEFGNMARMVNEFFIQKDKLVAEIEVRTEAEMKIRISEEKLRSSLREKEVLIKEVHHRVKNNLQIIISLIRLQVNRIQDENITGHLNKILNRIRSISLVHEMLYRSPDLSRINFNDYICRITDSLRTIYADESRDLKIEVYAEDILLGVDAAVPCAVIINELVTNSIKHAFIGSKSGIINISMIKDCKNYLLKVSDNGVGISGDMKIDETKSLGMHLVSTLADQLDAKLKIEREKGTAFILEIPIVD